MQLFYSLVKPFEDLFVRKPAISLGRSFTFLHPCRQGFQMIEIAIDSFLR
jgi:hypothetical protein